MKTFNVPEFYRSPIISAVKQFRKEQDPRKKDNSPTVLDFGPVQFYVARHFGFCYGVENAIEIAFKAIGFPSSPVMPKLSSAAILCSASVMVGFPHRL